MRVAEGGGEEVAEAAVEDFQGEHGFPVADCEADSVCVDGDDAGVHLQIIKLKLGQKRGEIPRR